MAKAQTPRRSAGRETPYFELAIRLGCLALLLYWTFTLVEPFISIVIWAVIIAVALYPFFQWTARILGGREAVAATLVTIVSLLVVIGPVTWLTLDLIDSARILSEQFDWSTLAIPQPWPEVKSWPLIGEDIHRIWSIAATNTRDALVKLLPYLKPFGTTLLAVATGAGTGMIKFFISIIVAGFLFTSAPTFVEGVKRFARRLETERGEELIALAGNTIRSVSRGVVGIAVLQALLAGIGLAVAHVPAASLLTFAILILGIIQIGPSVVIIPLIIWSWFSMETTAAVLFTAYMIPVNLVDNLVRPFVLGHGLRTPMLVVFIGVIGGTLGYGLTGLFLGPIVLAVIWELLVAWIGLREEENA